MKTIKLTQGREAFVDECDFERINKHKWSYHSTGYAVRRGKLNGKKTLIRMHRFIVDAPSGVLVDHINGIGTDNRRENLRLASHKENQWNRSKNKNNTSGFKGVSRNRSGWRARITVDNKEIHLGTFKTATQAARAYDRASKKHYGKFGRLNFPKARPDYRWEKAAPGKGFVTVKVESL
jgi:hypothetical protein